MGIHKPDGTLNWISINSQPLIQADGDSVYGVLASFTDITALRRTEQLLMQKTRELAEAQSEIQRLKSGRSASAN